MDTIKPSRLYLINSVVVLGISVFFTSLGLSRVATLWDLTNLLTALILLPFSLATGLLQYRAAYGRSTRAALTLAKVLFAGNGFLVLVALVATAETFKKMDSVSLVDIEMLATGYVLGAYGLFCAWINLRWACVLRMSQLADAAVSRGYHFSRRELLGWSLITAATTGTTMWFIRARGPQSAEHVSREDAPFSLPEGATDVCYCQFCGLTYEFTIDEPGFLAWADTRLKSMKALGADARVQPIQGSFEICRYGSHMSANRGLESATINHGYYYSWIGENGARVQYAYDLETQRAYHHLATH